MVAETGGKPAQRRIARRRADSCLPRTLSRIASSVRSLALRVAAGVAGWDEGKRTRRSRTTALVLQIINYEAVDRQAAHADNQLFGCTRSTACLSFSSKILRFTKRVLSPLMSMRPLKARPQPAPCRMYATTDGPVGIG